MTRIELGQLPDIQARLSRDIPESLEELTTNADYTIAVASLRLEDEYRMMAVIAFLRDADVDAFHRNMYLAASVRRRFLQCVSRGMKAEPAYLFATYDKAIYEALCAGEPRVLADLAGSRLTTKADERFDNPYYYYFALALRMFILRKPDIAADLLKDFDEFRAGALEGYAQVARGLLQKDQKLFKKGIAAAVEERKAEIAQDENVNVGEQWLSVECLALSRLGHMYGLTAGMKSSLIPDELQRDSNIAFDDPDTVLPPIPATFVELPEESVADDE